MIDFRYHIVSIVAVFLALALGLVLGTTFIDPLVVGDLKSQVTKLVNDKRGLQSDVESLRAQAADGTAFARAATLPLVKDQLAGRTVVLVSLPGVTTGLRDDLLALLDKSGARVSTRVTLTDRYGDPTQDALLASTVSAATPTGVVLSGTTASQRAAELLAAVLTESTEVPSGPPSVTVSATPTGVKTRTPGSRTPTATAPPTASPTVSPTASPTPTATPPVAGPITTVLDAYRAAGLLTIDVEQPMPANLVLVLTPEGPTDGRLPATVDLSRYVDVVGALAGGRHADVVMAGPSSSLRGGALSSLRGSGVANIVSSVDSADSAYGLVATIRALRARLFGTVGRYGNAPGDVALPESATAQ